ncbi:hypothetical protein [Sphaerisporangium corydalis]|uniref:Uncharacterized protein n=1 Tax=Sphaerisporangium corydalis TaxID=1441875 RepID=A0ABV9EP57_9ACTN|nr:hypothetical protein [Sphaerisporangium corydalis]
MMDGAAGLGLTFLLALVSATVFLVLRCQRLGRPFGPSSRWLALLVIVLTAVATTAVALLVTGVSDKLHALVGVVAPSGLWLGYMRQRQDGRRSLAQEILTFWLASLLERLHQTMAEDREIWCEGRIDDSWTVHELSMAAEHYHERIRQRMSVEERRKERVQARLQAIERRLDVATLIEDSVGRSKVIAALGGSAVTNKVRYQRYLNDFGRLHGVLVHDAERELSRLLDSAYRCGLRSLPRYDPAVLDLTRARSHP